MAIAAAKSLRTLTEAYQDLDPSQKEAVNSREDAVVVAGPGSGKTDTLALKAALLLSEIRAPQGVACITYTRAAASEISDRIAQFGVRRGRRLFTGTLHSFCLRVVIKPFAAAASEPELPNRTVIGSRTAAALLSRAADDIGVSNPPGEPRLQWMRRVDVCGEDLDEHFDQFEIETMRRYEELLVAGDSIDFDGLIHEALRLIQRNPQIGRLLAARFPWLLVDEYQDLGGPLHHLVESLREAGIKIMAVGDPDQTIMQFTGADARYMTALEETGCSRVVLPFNYRSGRTLVEAASGALGVERNYESDPDNPDEGEVISTEVEGGLAAQAETVAGEVIPRFQEEGRALHEIAIFYPQRGALPDLITAALDRHGVPYSLERDARFGRYLGEIIGWLQRCARWALDAPGERVVRFRDLADQFRSYLVDARDPAGATSLAAAELLYGAVDAPADREALLLDWLNQLVTKLDLERVLADGQVNAEDLDSLAALLKDLRGPIAGTTLEVFAGPMRRPGHVVVTTYHSSKGREFDVVILPGLQDGIMPRSRKVRGNWRMGNVAHDRNLFYVAFTRARHTVALLWSSSSEDAYGNAASWPPSRFLSEIQEQTQ